MILFKVAYTKSILFFSLCMFCTPLFTMVVDKNEVDYSRQAIERLPNFYSWEKSETTFRVPSGDEQTYTGWYLKEKNLIDKDGPNLVSASKKLSILEESQNHSKEISTLLNDKQKKNKKKNIEKASIKEMQDKLNFAEKLIAGKENYTKAFLALQDIVKIEPVNKKQETAVGKARYLLGFLGKTKKKTIKRNFYQDFKIGVQYGNTESFFELAKLQVKDDIKESCENFKKFIEQTENTNEYQKERASAFWRLGMVDLFNKEIGKGQESCLEYLKNAEQALKDSGDNFNVIAHSMDGDDWNRIEKKLISERPENINEQNLRLLYAFGRLCVEGTTKSARKRLEGGLLSLICTAENGIKEAEELLLRGGDSCLLTMFIKEKNNKKYTSVYPRAQSFLSEYKRKNENFIEHSGKKRTVAGYKKEKNHKRILIIEQADEFFELGDIDKAKKILQPLLLQGDNLVRTRTLCKVVECYVKSGIPLDEAIWQECSDLLKEYYKSPSGDYVYLLKYLPENINNCVLYGLGACKARAVEVQKRIAELYQSNGIMLIKAV